jgi:hypothetical protein
MARPPNRAEPPMDNPLFFKRFVVAGAMPGALGILNGLVYSKNE